MTLYILQNILNTFHENIDAWMPLIYEDISPMHGDMHNFFGLSGRALLNNIISKLNLFFQNEY